MKTKMSRHCGIQHLVGKKLLYCHAGKWQKSRFTKVIEHKESIINQLIATVFLFAIFAAIMYILPESVSAAQ